MQGQEKPGTPSRREFLKTGAVAAAGFGLPNLDWPRVKAVATTQMLPWPLPQGYGCAACCSGGAVTGGFQPAWRSLSM